jgi:hypothetical protein
MLFEPLTLILFILNGVMLGVSLTFVLLKFWDSRQMLKFRAEVSENNVKIATKINEQQATITNVIDAVNKHEWALNGKKATVTTAG